MGVLVREKSTLGLDRTRELLEVDKDILSKTMAAITATAKAGQLKAVMTAIMVTQKLQEIDAHKVSKMVRRRFQRQSSWPAWPFAYRLLCSRTPINPAADCSSNTVSNGLSYSD